MKASGGIKLSAEPVYKLMEVVRFVKKTLSYSILVKYGSFLMNIKIRCLKMKDWKAELRNEENLTSDGLIPCSFCCELCKGIQL